MTIPPNQGFGLTDPTTLGQITIMQEHYEIHHGEHYFIQGNEDLAINNVLDIQFTTPDSAAWSHFVLQLDCESETEWFIYEGATISTPGTAATPINNNRNSSNTSANTVATITNTSVANANADTAVAGATLLANGVVGAGKTGGTVERSREIMLKQNTIYCIRAVANTAGNVSYNAQWYEHEDIL